MKHFLFFSGILAALCGCAPRSSTAPVTKTPLQTKATATATSRPTPEPLFEYDSSIPFDIKVNSETERDGVTVVDMSYAAHDPAFSPKTLGRTVAYLVKPHGPGPFAGVIYMHWLGETQSGRGQYLDEAVALAQRGVVCLLPQGVFPWMSAQAGNENDRQLIIGQVTELRRAVDFLLAQPGVESKRLGYVGHDYSAMHGAILSGTEQRLKTYVLVAGVPSFADWAPYWGIERETALPITQDVEPVQHIGRAAPASIFFQFARNDSFVTSEAANTFYEGASEPKKIEYYDDTHEMATGAVREAREAWLAEQLGLDPSPGPD
jgi:dienelactone hydrolase